MTATGAGRLRTLDLIRGVAVLGIAAVNVATFAAPYSQGFSPNLTGPASRGDAAAFAFTLLFFEGKMRALFSILFGASLVLFVTRREEAGREGALLQLRRLGWLALIGWLHFVLLWDGDILFLYALVGIGALVVHRAPPAALGLLALLTFTVWQGAGTLRWAESVRREAAVQDGIATPAEQRDHAAIIAQRRHDDASDRTVTMGSWPQEVGQRVSAHPFYPLEVTILSWAETLPYMMIGMALLASGFFSGGWRRRWLWAIAVIGVGAGGGLTLWFMAWAQPRGYPELAMHMAVGYALSWPHLLMALGYTALLVLTAPRLLRLAPGRWLESAGRMALSNYIASTLFFCAVFYGWGLGLFGRYGPAGQWTVVLALWALLLSASTLWLKRFRQGPLEWAWRSLTEWQRLPLRRPA